MKSVLLLGVAREKSSRLPNKMILPFGGTSLFEIYTKKLEEINEMNNPFSNIIMAVNRKDKTLWDMATRSTLNICERSDASVAHGYRGVAHFQDFLENYDDDYVMCINGCFPFLEVKTILDVANLFIENKNIEALICAKRRYNMFWDMNSGKCINNTNPKLMDTGSMKPIGESVNHIIMYNRKFMLENDCYWTDAPYIHVVEDDIQTLDIDTNLEFDICEALWKQSK